MSLEGEEQNVPYELRYCAFIDILGFSELISDLEMGDTSVESLRDLMRVVHAPPRGKHLRSCKDSDIKAQSMSDSICLSAANSPAGLYHVLYTVEELARELLQRGYFIRGAIVKGALYHEDVTVFGEALVRAYRLEQKVARYPRVLVTRDVAMEVQDDFLEKRDLADFLDCLRQADDGPHFVHILNLLEAVLENVDILNENERTHHIEEFNQMAKHIQTRLDHSLDNPSHFEKVQWFARYWNRCLKKYSAHVNLISGPDLERPLSMWNFYP